MAAPIIARVRVHGSGFFNNFAAETKNKPYGKD